MNLTPALVRWFITNSLLLVQLLLDTDDICSLSVSCYCWRGPDAPTRAKECFMWLLEIPKCMSDDGSSFCSVFFCQNWSTASSHFCPFTKNYNLTNMPTSSNGWWSTWSFDKRAGLSFLFSLVIQSLCIWICCDGSSLNTHRICGHEFFTFFMFMHTNSVKSRTTWFHGFHPLYYYIDLIVTHNFTSLLPSVVYLVVFVVVLNWIEPDIST